ncbi:leucine-rich repeat-containing protein 43, partial [Gracilinanus agilis]|uniref:leucine-rich repeat-containing protein 43 n=1 Tax=Gracilinanus agilis TaxID=191870 RepID=UPI001CFD2BE9
MEAELGTVTVSKAYKEHLRKLCLQEFPCGLGSWNKARFSPQHLKTQKGLIPKMPEKVPPEEESMESLLRLAQSAESPWALDKDATMEDQYLRELAIQNPFLIGDDFLFSYFKSLRLVNKGITLVDEGLIKFFQLEELILSANRIQTVDPMNLPRTLKVLELYGNEMTSIQCLCSHPPPALQHLGMGHNKLIGSLESHFLTATFWSNLVSLDLSCNDLTGLRYIVASLATLQKLRLLLLQGNPLALLPHYRGYTIDCLSHLFMLDEITVSPEERHLFQGISCKLGKVEEAACLTVTIKNVTGILDSSLLDPEPPPEGPLNVYSYYVTYNFMPDEKSIGKGSGSTLYEPFQPISVPVLSVLLSKERLSKNELSPGHSKDSRNLEDSGEPKEPAEPQDPQLIPPPGSVFFNTEQKPWENVIEFDYKKKHILKDLVKLKAFLSQGTRVNIVEEKVASWLILPSPVDSPPAVKKGKGEKDKKEKEK